MKSDVRFNHCVLTLSALSLIPFLFAFLATGNSTRLAYTNFFAGSISFEPWKKVWKSWAPGKCKTFLWLTIQNRCWTADRLQKKRPPTSGALPSLRPGRGKHSAHLHFLCFCEAILVCHFTALKPDSIDTHEEYYLR